LPELRDLHIDDEDVQLGFTKSFLEGMDGAIQVISAKNPQEVLNLLTSETFDCVVCDYQMPEMDGIELSQRIRDTSDVPIIIYTGRGSEEVAERAFEVGINDYIRKEINPSHYQVLIRRIRAAVEKHRGESNSRYILKVLTTISNVNQYLLKERDVSEETILSIISDLLVDSGAYLHAHILRTDRQANVLSSYTDNNKDEFTDFFGGLTHGSLPICIEKSIESEGVHILHGTKECGDCPLVTNINEPCILTTRLSIGEDLFGVLTGLAPRGRVGDEEQSLFLELAGDLSHFLRHREMEEEIRSIARFPGESTNPVLRISHDGDILYANPAAETVLSEWGRGIGEKAPEDWIEHVETAIESGLHDQEYTIRGRVLSFRFTPLKEFDYVNIYTRDVTEQRKAEVKILDLARFPSKNKNPVMRISSKGVILYANDASASLLDEWETAEGGKVPKAWRKYVLGVLREGVGR
jgi:CheY-like chemotaxis protein